MLYSGRKATFQQEFWNWLLSSIPCDSKRELDALRLSTTVCGQPVGKVNSTKIVRSTSLKSPVPSASAFESAEESDDVDLTDKTQL
ncbi:hypothetical protein C5167_003803 [Papaver somniferum]|uniref:Uncharacterized protein n=1 Tax=Papaver somniferum TaxID=3469 RepID=A0A4Y7L5S5_PAPSO|nr:hypothetical protein C5167_003803 [Papaver somniferum]